MKIKLTLILLCLVSIRAFPQEFRLTIQPEATLGKMIPVKTIWNEADQVDISDPFLLNDDRMMTGFGLTARAGYLPLKWLGFQTGLEYLQQGGFYKNYEGEFSQKVFRSHYLSVPLEISLLPDHFISFFGGYQATVLLAPAPKFRNPCLLNRFGQRYFYGIGLRLWKTRLKISHYRSLSSDMTFLFSDMGKVDYYYSGFDFSFEIPVRIFLSTNHKTDQASRLNP